MERGRYEWCAATRDEGNETKEGGSELGFGLRVGYLFSIFFIFSIDKWMDGCGMMDGWMGAMSSIHVKPTPPMGIEYM